MNSFDQNDVFTSRSRSRPRSRSKEWKKENRSEYRSSDHKSRERSKDQTRSNSRSNFSTRDSSAGSVSSRPSEKSTDSRPSQYRQIQKHSSFSRSSRKNSEKKKIPDMYKLNRSPSTNKTLHKSYFMKGQNSERFSDWRTQKKNWGAMVVPTWQMLAGSTELHVPNHANFVSTSGIKQRILLTITYPVLYII